MKIFNSDILIKKTSCNCADLPGHPIPPSVNLFVKVTKGCNAHCAFCSNAGCQSPTSLFDIEKMIRIIYELKSKGIIVNRMNITGGEPSVVSPLVVRILDAIDKEHFDDVHLHLNTNGVTMQAQDLMQHPRWDSISMSLHHYDVNRLSDLYGCEIPAHLLHFTGVDKQKINFSCNLIKGYIDNKEEVRKMLDLTLDTGIRRIGFVALMPVNSFCKEHFIDIDDIPFAEIPHVYFTGAKDRGADCKCSNYLYNKNLRILEIYMRNYANPQYSESSLVYDGAYLRQGFYNNNIIY